MGWQRQRSMGKQPEVIVVREATAWELIGWDDGPIRIKGGRTIYEAVMYNDATRGDKVKLARLEPTENWVREVSRWVDPDTLIEVLQITAPPGQKARPRK